MKFKKTLLALLAALLGVGGYAGYETLGGGGGISLTRCQPFVATSTQQVTAAGTHYYVEEDNAFFITANATSTFECTIGNADMVDLNLFFVGSSTAAYPTWDYEFSYDGNEWFQPTLFLDGADFVTTVGTSSLGFWNGIDGAADGNGTTTINIQIEPLASPRIRVNLGAGGGEASVYPEIIKRNRN